MYFSYFSVSYYAEKRIAHIVEFSWTFISRSSSFSHKTPLIVSEHLEVGELSETNRIICSKSFESQNEAFKNREKMIWQNQKCDSLSLEMCKL